MSELKELSWKQQGNEVIITVQKENGEELNFLLEEKIINYLAGNTPKMYFFHIEINNESEKSYLVDFEKLKSIVSTKNSLKISLGKTKRKNQYEGITPKGKYCIARGESYYDRHINDKGWQHQRKYYDLFEISDIKTSKKAGNLIVPGKNENSKEELEIQNNLSNKSSISTQSTQKSGGKLKECINCGEIIPTKMEICPYCKASQNPEKEDEIIDISI